MTSRSLLTLLPCVLLAVPAFFMPSATPDWPAFYAAARLPPAQLYDLDASNRVTAQFMPPQYVWAFVRPPFYALILRPLGWMTPRAAFYVWQAVNLAAIGFFCWVIYPDRMVLSVLVTALFHPLWTSFRQGQDMPLLLALLGLCTLLLRHKREFWAGWVLALCSVKFHLLLALPVYLLARRSGKTALGILAAGSVLAALSFTVFGLDWPARYYACVMENQRRIETFSLLFLLKPWWWPAAVSTATVAAVYAGCRRIADFQSALSLCLAAGYVLAPRVFRYDMVILIPALLTLTGLAIDALNRKWPLSSRQK